MEDQLFYVYEDGRWVVMRAFTRREEKLAGRFADFSTDAVI